MRALVVKVTAGSDDLERCNQGLTVAATAAAAGASVSLWLTGEAAWLAVPDLLEGVITLGTVTVCSQCALRRGLTQDSLMPGVRIAGAAAFVEEALADRAQALVY